jgi:hypothetical protein
MVFLIYATTVSSSIVPYMKGYCKNAYKYIFKCYKLIVA